MLSGADEGTVQALRSYGRHLGMAFQVVDDILDVRGNADEVGKPVGNDLLNGVVTLPVLEHRRLNPGDSSVAEFFANPEDKGPANRILIEAASPQVIDAAYAFAGQMCDRARSSLKVLPDMADRSSLEDLLDYVMARDR